MAPDTANIRVMARVNPKPGSVCLHLENGDTIIPLEETGGRHHHKFHFDNVFDQQAKQTQVFEEVGKPTVDKILQGYNGTVFAYGQTGSGKTHTMLAPEGGSSQCLDPLNTESYAQRGLIPRMATELFERLEAATRENKALQHTVTASYYEIYNEELIDLLRPANDKRKIRLEGTKETFKISGLVAATLEGPAKLLDLIAKGTAKRHVASTAMNDTSSRSHSIIQINIVQNDTVLKHITTSQLNLVDLAGCESLGRTGATGQTAFEGTRINLSLTTLGIVISQLCRNEKYISFRDSLITRVLQNSLGGNALTTVVVTMSQLRENYADTMSVLRFAERAKQIKNKARINKQRTAAEWQMLCKQAEEEVEVLKQRLLLAGARTLSPLHGPDQVQDLKARLAAELVAQDDLKELLAEKEKENFRLEKRLQSTADELDETRNILDDTELEKCENAAMYHAMQDQLKQTKEEVVAERTAKTRLQNQINKLEIEMAGMSEELKHREDQVVVSSSNEMMEKTEKILSLEREIESLREQLLKRDKEIANMKQMWEAKEESFNKQISALKNIGSDSTIEEAIKAALEQQSGTADMLKIENDALRAEVQELKQKIVKNSTDLATQAAEAASAKKQVEAFQIIQEKNKASHTEMLAAVKRNAQESAALKQDNLRLNWKLAGGTARVDSLLKSTEAERDHVMKELDTLMRNYHTCKTELEEAQHENKRLNDQLREVELVESRLENEAEKAREEVYTLGRTVSMYNGKMKQKDDNMTSIKNSMKGLAQLILKSNLPRSEMDDMLLVVNRIAEPKDRDMIDKLADKIYDEKAQHELVGHVVAVMEDRIADVRSMEAKVEAIARDDDVVPESLKENLSMLKRQLGKVMEVLSIREYTHPEDEDQRQDMLPAATVLLEKVKGMEHELEELQSMGKSGTHAVCPFCQELFDKKLIRSHVNQAH
eukprot:TRINITY_DN4864_c4_g1_i1.p1 TRINITY_DN4864_c4_g1~~TRINITY_DN4864_c4_g1_i1.p1  ORF type:complete len:946 (+),score=302.41 TRINITY_DN4864_c4_g1_i1:55-2892(+)